MHVKAACIVADHWLYFTYGQEEECDEMQTFVALAILWDFIGREAQVGGDEA